MKEMDGGRKKARGCVCRITIAARESLIKWRLAQCAWAPCSWWRRERMSSDNRERDGREDMRGCISREGEEWRYQEVPEWLDTAFGEFPP